MRHKHTTRIIATPLVFGFWRTFTRHCLQDHPNGIFVERDSVNRINFARLHGTDFSPDRDKSGHHV